MLLMVGTADACPTCKLASAENGFDPVRGYFWSILFMMSMPFLILGGLGTMFYLDVRRARKLQTAKPQSEPAMSSLSAGSAI